MAALRQDLQTVEAKVQAHYKKVLKANLSSINAFLREKTSKTKTAVKALEEVVALTQQNVEDLHHTVERINSSAVQELKQRLLAAETELQRLKDPKV